MLAVRIQRHCGIEASFFGFLKTGFNGRLITCRMLIGNHHCAGGLGLLGCIVGRAVIDDDDDAVPACRRHNGGDRRSLIEGWNDYTELMSGQVKCSWAFLAHRNGFPRTSLSCLGEIASLGQGRRISR